jgi:hypothetical protein
MQEEEAIEEVAAPQVMLLGRKTLLPLFGAVLRLLFFSFEQIPYASPT